MMTAPPEIDFDTELLQQVAGLLPALDFSRHTRVSPLSKSENTVFLIEDPELDDKYVARVNSGRVAYHNRPMIESEMSWLMALHNDTAIPVPAVLSSPQNETVHEIELPVSGSKHFVAVYSFLNGSEPAGDNLPGSMRMLGAITAQLHNHSKSWQSPDGFIRPTWTGDAILDDELGWGHWKNGAGIEGQAAASLARAEQVLRSRIESLPCDRNNHGLIHGDLRLANLLADGDTISVIDFDDCGYGWFLFDLPAAISFIEEHPEIETLQNNWISGYQSVAAGGLDLIEELPSLLLLRRYALLAWLGYQQDHLQFARDIGLRFTEATVQQAEDYIARFG